MFKAEAVYDNIQDKQKKNLNINYDVIQDLEVIHI